MMLRTRTLLVTLCLLPALLLCLPLQASDVAKDKVILQLKWLHQFQFAGYYAALEKGFLPMKGLRLSCASEI